MKKHILAAAVAAAVSSGAYAQNLTVGGVFDTGIQSIDAKGARFNNVASNGSATSVLQFRGTEDLGGGLRATFQLEVAPALTETSSRTNGTSATGATSNVTSFLGNGNSWVGLAGHFGEIKFGTPNIATLSINGDGNGGFATAVGSGYRVTSFDAVRFQNSLRYDTPTVGGLSASVVHVPKNSVQSNAGLTGLTGNLQNQINGRDQVMELAVAFAQGPLSARAATLRMDQFHRPTTSVSGDPFGTGLTTAAVALTNPGANFRLDSATVGFQATKDLKVNYFYQKVSSDLLAASGTSVTYTTKFDREMNGVSAAYTMGATTFRVNYQEAKNGNQAAGTGTANQATQTIGLGADYALSKRTALYLRHENNDDKAGLRSTTGLLTVTGNNTYKATALGLRHSF